MSSSCCKVNTMLTFSDIQVGNRTAVSVHEHSLEERGGAGDNQGMEEQVYLTKNIDGQGWRLSKLHRIKVRASSCRQREDAPISPTTERTSLDIPETVFVCTSFQPCPLSQLCNWSSATLWLTGGFTARASIYLIILGSVK